jgi:hypothetical protein
VYPEGSCKNWGRFGRCRRWKARPPAHVLVPSASLYTVLRETTTGDLRVSFVLHITWSSYVVPYTATFLSIEVERDDVETN